jgi:hypothetical protein
MNLEWFIRPMNSQSKSKSKVSWSARANHSQIVQDEYIQKFLEDCRFPKKPSLDQELSQDLVEEVSVKKLEKKFILTVDGSYTLVKTKKEFPSSEIAFFQFGAILFGTDDLDNLSEKTFIAPEDIKQLHNLQKIKFALPVKNVVSGNQRSLNDSIRKELYSFFMREKDQLLSLMDTLCWIIFEEYSDSPKSEYILASDPNIGGNSGKIILRKENMSSEYTFSHHGKVIYLTDIFRLHEVIDEDFGAAGILGYISRLIEQLFLMRYIHLISSQGSSLLNDFVFISNGPLSFSGQTANMHKPFRSICTYLSEKFNFCYFGLEKSGPFADHALEICKSEDNKFYLDKGSVLVLSNDYIYKFVTPGDPETMHYGETSYYGGKVIVHTDDGQIYVVSIPTDSANIILAPSLSDYKNVDTVISILKRLKCDMYSDTIVPVALANKLISLAGHPSQSILEKYASEKFQ